MNETPTNSAHQPGHTRKIPRAKLWIVGGLLFIAAVGMYAGTMYRIKNYGYVGVGDDRPIVDPTSQTSTPKPN